MKPKNEKRQYGRGCCAVDWWLWLLRRRLVVVAAAPSTGGRAAIELGDQLIDIMDPRLHVAACNGDVGALQKLLQEDPLVLSEATLSTSSSNSPLHIAALLGHTDFAKFVMSLNPELSRELNHQGYSPIHLASFKGHLQIVTELLNFDKGLCFLQDCEGRTPLHGAAIKGRLEVITHLMSCCSESAMEVTDKGETLLHLVVNNGQKEAMVLLISSLRELNLLHKLIDCCDEDGKTALQLAIARNHQQMTKMLSKERENHEDEITDHERNKQEAVLIDMDNQNQKIKTLSIDQKHETIADETKIPNPSRGSNGDRGFSRKDKLASLHNAIIVLCSLLATCCFDAIISPPGGVWQTRPSKDVIQAENITNVPAFFENFMEYDYTNMKLTDLFKTKKERECPKLLMSLTVNVDAVNACGHTAADISTSMCSSQSDNNLYMNGDHDDDQSHHSKK
ncbi:hypothetical protein EZV62_020905 [Acer yangbiense]|uniref:PGG domain-containing protein n=1 Tax=Acer yangbiense TaxID=1000413 RepID=A0A5C7HFN4_9ROSI|nr:hypothetical protein EZV62_020905 [Acer yangbiense]